MAFIKLLSSGLPQRKLRLHTSPDLLNPQQPTGTFSHEVDIIEVVDKRKTNVRPDYFQHGDKGILTFIFLLSIWCLTNVLQSIFTQIGNDEAYYWLFSKHLDWGYFDHPPMIALWIRAGTLFFSSELGVRFMVILMQLLSLVLLWKTIDNTKPTRRNVILFFVIAAAIPLFQIYGFIATPDAALLFFTTMFLFFYKNFLRGKTWFYTFLLGITMACLMYSKYHGALIILFTIASNPRLLLGKHFITAASIALLLFLPHLNWQIQHEFPTLQFQMTERFKSFRIQHFLEYWPYQLLAFNPLVILLLGYIFMKTKLRGSFQRALMFQVIGFLFFFWVLSFWVRPEPHWTAAASIPAIILLFNSVVSHSERRKYVYQFVFPSLLLLLLARLLVIFQFVPVKLEFHGQKEWAQQVAHEAGNLPVAFVNSYQKASVYSFYTGNTAFSLNNVYYRRNQFDIWAWDQDFQNKKIATLVPYHPRISIDTLSNKNHNGVLVKNNLTGTQRIRIDLDLPPSSKLIPGQKYEIAARITNPFPSSINFDNPSNQVSCSAMLCKSGKWYMANAVITPPVVFLKGNTTVNATISFISPHISPGQYNFGIGLRTPFLLEGFNSSFFQVEILP